MALQFIHTTAQKQAFFLLLFLVGLGKRQADGRGVGLHGIPDFITLSSFEKSYGSFWSLLSDTAFDAEEWNARERFVERRRKPHISFDRN